MLIVEIEKGMVDWRALTQCQDAAARGSYAQAVAGFIIWIAPHYADVRRGMSEQYWTYRSAATRNEQIKRLPGIVAGLAIGWSWFLDYAADSGAITTEQRDDLWQRGWVALLEAADRQAGHLAASDSVHRYLTLLRVALASGDAHITELDGSEPEESPEAWGWRFHEETY
jgi:hypothetical protein